MKHYGMNNQETNRNTFSANVDARTAFEVYHRSFQECINHGVAAAMCSYNLVNGTYACDNAELLTHHLKDTMGFKGWVMSDWAATHSITCLESGLDQDMPGSAVDCNGVGVPGCPPNNAPSWFDPSILEQKDPEKIDNAVFRILLSMIRVGVMDETWCDPPNCGRELYVVVCLSCHVIDLHHTLRSKNRNSVSL